MRFLKAKSMRKEIKIINAALPIFIYTSLVSLKRRMWKMGCLILPKFQHILDDWHASALWREGCSAHGVNETGACSEETILPEETPTHSEPGSDNLGTGLGPGSMLETGRQQRWDALTAGREEVVTHWRLPGGCAAQHGPRWRWALHLAQLWSQLKLFPAQPGEQWFHAAISIKEGTPSQRDLKAFFRTLRHHSTVYHSSCFGNAEVEDTWRSTDMKIA